MAGNFIHNAWMSEQAIPIYRGYAIEDLRTIDLEWWELRQSKAAFLQFVGMEGVVEARVHQIEPGGTLPAAKVAVDELVYVLGGRGTCSVWLDNGPKKNFEWAERSLFVIPRNCCHQFSNMDGRYPARLLHYNCLPMAMSAIPDPDFFFNNPYSGSLDQEAFYSEARAQTEQRGGVTGPAVRQVWSGNFFPDLLAWDKLVPFRGRGAGGHVVHIRPPKMEMYAHMSVFPAKTYKKAHRHGPGRLIVIPAGEGYSIMWPEGEEKVIIRWHEASCFVPPGRWFHQHFNLGSTPARYLALHPPAQFAGRNEKVEDLARDQIEYPHEEPWIREMFEAELAQRGLQTAMPAHAYSDPSYEWAYEDED